MFGIKGWLQRRAFNLAVAHVRNQLKERFKVQIGSKALTTAIGTAVVVIGGILLRQYTDMPPEMINEIMLVVAGLFGVKLVTHAYTDTKVTSEFIKAGKIEPRK